MPKSLVDTLYNGSANLIVYWYSSHRPGHRYFNLDDATVHGITRSSNTLSSSETLATNVTYTYKYGIRRRQETKYTNWDFATAIYKTERTQLGSFLEMTRCVLQSLAGHAQEIEETIHHKFRTSVDRLPKGTRTVTLMYHQVSYIATSGYILS